MSLINNMESIQEFVKQVQKKEIDIVEYTYKKAKSLIIQSKDFNFYDKKKSSRVKTGR